MLAELNVRDIALIREASVEFGPHLNILTGETGAGKSVIIGSALLSLGAKAHSDMIREGASSAYTELVFTVEDPERIGRLQELGVEIPEDQTFVFSRKIAEGRSLCRLNGETVKLVFLREAARELIDICGQNDYHSLFDTSKHLEILDAYLGERAAESKKQVRKAYEAWKKCKSVLGEFRLEEGERLRELSLADYEITEIDEAHLIPGEEEELAVLYRKLNNSRNLEEALSAAWKELEAEDLAEAIAFVSQAQRYDEELSGIRSELLDAQAILEDALSGIRRYVSGLDLSGEKLEETEKRLDLIRGLEAKYGKTPEEIQKYREKKLIRKTELEFYEENRKRAEAELEKKEKELETACNGLSTLRKSAAGEFCERLQKELLELGFDAVRLRLDFERKAPSADGTDAVCFMAALNPGEIPKPLSQVASGGELSRVMLGIRTVLAAGDATPTLIFDEIDAGISGRTAQKVAEKLDLIARNHQVICITHLPQIASMADTHFLIEKKEENGRNVTEICRLNGEESATELARMLGGVKVTDAVLRNAREMKRLAEEIKKEHQHAKE